MLRNTIVALSATAALGVALAPAAQAKTNIDFNLGIGIPVGGVYVGDGYYDDDYGVYDEDCDYVKVKHKKVKSNGKIKVWYTKELVCY